MQKNDWNKTTLLALAGMIFLLAGIIALFLIEGIKGGSMHAYAMIAVAVIIIAIGAMYVYLIAKGKIWQTGPDYRGFFYIGVIFLPLAISNPPLVVFSLVFIAIGLANKDKWKPETKWSEMPPARRNFKIAILTVLAFLVAVSFVLWYLGAQQPKPATNQLSNQTTDIEQNTESSALANPASQNCVQQGGTLEMRENKNGQYGVCLFEDNRQCEEWALFRGDCPVGGLKITGYENDAEIYCAITGGQVEGVGTPTPMCKRIDGTYCNAQSNLDGDCPDPNNPNPNAGNIEAP